MYILHFSPNFLNNISIKICFTQKNAISRNHNLKLIPIYGHIIFNYSLILSSSGFSVSVFSTSGLSTSGVDSSGFIFSGFVVLPWLLVSGFCVTVLFVCDVDGFCVTILFWQYSPPYDWYNLEGCEECLEELLYDEYYSVLNQKEQLIGFFCFGQSAQVSAGKMEGFYRDHEYLDIGLGM